MLMQLLGRFVRQVKAQQGHGDLHALIDSVGLGPRHLPPLFILATNGPMSIGVLADRTALSPATVSQLVGELERAGLVVRRPDDRDRRRTIVSLAERHAAVIEEITRRRVAPLRKAMATLSAEERATFIRSWQVLVETQELFAESGYPPAASCETPGAPDTQERA